MTASVTLHQDASATHAYVLALADGQSFITLSAGGVDLILLGLDAVSVSQARLMADALLTAAADLHARLIASSSNGQTPDLGSGDAGSTPAEAAIMGEAHS